MTEECRSRRRSLIELGPSNNRFLRSCRSGTMSNGLYSHLQIPRKGIPPRAPFSSRRNRLSPYPPAVSAHRCRPREPHDPWTSQWCWICEIAVGRHVAAVGSSRDQQGAEDMCQNVRLRFTNGVWQPHRPAAVRVRRRVLRKNPQCSDGHPNPR